MALVQFEGAVEQHGCAALLVGGYPGASGPDILRKEEARPALDAVRGALGRFIPVGSEQPVVVRAFRQVGDGTHFQYAVCGGRYAVCSWQCFS